jgi:ribosomal protein S1
MEPGVEALLHRSELGLKKTESIKKHISAGDTIEVEIQTLDVEAKKMSLKCIQFVKNEQPNSEE